MKISIIVAMDLNRVIGNKGKLPWHLPADLKRFKKLTLGKPVIMGRKTFESVVNILGGPLPGRENFILTRQKDFRAPGCYVEEEFNYAFRYLLTGEDEVFIIGGAEIYKEALPLVDRMYITLIHSKFEGDVFFPEIDWGRWKKVFCRNYVADSKNPYAYSFLIYERI